MLKHGVIYFAGRMGASLVMLVAVAVYTRLLPPAEYGTYALVLSGAVMAHAGVMQWLRFALGRFLPAYREREAILLAHVAIGFVALAALVVIAALAVMPWLDADDRWRQVLALGVAFFVVMSFAELSLTVFQMRLEPQAYVLYLLLRVVVGAAIGMTLAWYGFGTAGLLLGLVIGNLCVVLPSLRRIWGGIRVSLLRRGLFRELAAYGVPFAMTGAFAAVINASDRYVIGALMGTDAAGLYAAPYDLAMRSLHVLMIVASMAGGPMIYRMYETSGRAASAPLIRRQAELLLGLALPGALALVLLAPAITHVLLGQAFQASARQLIPWIAAATVLLGVQSFYLALSFSLTKRPLHETAVVAVGALVNVILNLALIPVLGLIGAALATVVSYALIVVGCFILGRRLLPLPFPFAGVAKIVAGCAVMALILWPVHATTAPLAVALHAALASLAYLAILCALDVAATRAPARRLATNLIRAASAIVRPHRLRWQQRLL